jgi:hypothetical protein
LIKEAEGDDFGTYGIDRYNRAKEYLKKLWGEDNNESNFNGSRHGN